MRKALKNINVKYKLINYCEIDKYASKSYSIIHNVNEGLNLGDISKIDISKLSQNIDIITHGSPCTNYSVAGKGDGGDKNSGTASSLMWNTVEIVKHVRPKYIVWENVKNVLSKKHKHNFEQYINDLKELGYTSYYQILNAKDFGIPQSRERIFCISILGVHTPYDFPIGFTLQYRLKDFLEKNIDEKYYLPKEIQDRFTKFPKNRLNNNDLEVIGTTAPNPYDENGDKIIKEGNVSQYSKSQAGQVISDEGVSMTLCSGTQGYSMGYIKENNISNGAIRGRYNEQGEIEQRLEMRNDGCSNTITTIQKDNVITELKSQRLGGLFDTKKSKHQAGSVWDKEQLCPTLDTMQGGYRQPCIVDNTNKNEKFEVIDSFRIRRLTPKECWRLMGFDDEDVDKCIKIKISNTQLYKQAGNSICVPVLESIFKKLLQEYIYN
ncbi:DNA cytosine methyltransferase [Clostridioides difficile]|uniref:DNA cytosine methyltransferase n=1 Tax=Clostridioides difficile TaxID=1496 RepID=UPI002E8DCF94|nr:DNA cytosine methyltransferase [Clostridioides difficile]